MGKCCSTTKESNHHIHDNSENGIQNVKATNPKQPIKEENTEKPVTVEIPEVKKEKKIIKIRFYIEGKPIDMSPKEVLETEILNNVLDPVINNLPSLSEYTYHDKENKVLNIEDSLEKIFNTTDKDYNESQVNVINVVYEGLDIPPTREQIINQYSKATLIGNPVANSNPFELRIFCSENMELTKATFNIEDHPELITFSPFSAYCNGNNFLYLSGGETETKNPETDAVETTYLSWVSMINLNDGKLTKLEPMKNPRIWHSMIYVPNRYVFIVGGNKTPNVEVLNTETGEITEDSVLNQYHAEPSLCLVNSNFLYCFLGYNYDENSSGFSNIIERCNLRMKKRTWEIVTITNIEGERTTNDHKISTRFFALSYFNESNIIILGGDNMDKDVMDVEWEILANLGKASDDNNNNNNDDQKQVVNEKEKDKKPPQKHAFLYNFANDSIAIYDNPNKRELEEENAFINSRDNQEDKLVATTFNDITDVFPEKFFIPMKTNTNERVSCLIPMQSQDKLKIYLLNENHIEVKEFEDDLNFDSVVIQ